MHRFLRYAPIQNARIALRSDASVWLIANEGEHFEVNRGNDWVQAIRLRLCEGDRIRADGLEITLADLCAKVDIRLQTAGNDAGTDPVPLSAPASVIDNARRNPGTGQIEPAPNRSGNQIPGTKEQ